MSTATAETPAATYAEACTRSGCRPNKTFSRTLATLPADAELDCVDLSINVVGKNGANAVIELVARMPTVSRLLLRDNYLSNENVLFLVQRLVDHPALHTVDLRNNPISHAAGKALLRFVHANRRIKTVELEGTLINRALIRMICSAAEANGQEPPPEAPATDAAGEPSASQDAAAEPAAEEQHTEAEATIAPVVTSSAEHSTAASPPLTPRTKGTLNVMAQIAAGGFHIPPAIACMLASAGMRRRDTTFTVLPSLQTAAAAAGETGARQASLNVLWAAAFSPPPAPPTAQDDQPPASETVVADEPADIAPATEEAQTVVAESADASAPEAAPQTPAPAPAEEPQAVTAESGLALILQSAAEAGASVSALECVVEGGIVARRLPVLAAIAASNPARTNAAVEALLDASIGTHERARASPAPPATETVPCDDESQGSKAEAAGAQSNEAAPGADTSAEAQTETKPALQLVLHESSSEHAGLSLLTSLL